MLSRSRLTACHLGSLALSSRHDLVAAPPDQVVHWQRRPVYSPRQRAQRLGGLVGMIVSTYCPPSGHGSTHSGVSSTLGKSAHPILC
jgi:hypothetical protein